MGSLYTLTAHRLHKMLKDKEVSSEEITRAVLNRIDSVDENIRAYITVMREEAINKARQVDNKIRNGENINPLAGLPIAIKDNICTDGTRTTCASKIMYNYIPPYDATVVERLKNVDAIIIGKTNLDEFAMGSSCENSGFFPTSNPWSIDRVPGGSSGGSAAAIAADEAVLSLGSDTGGSIRLPAAYCGVVGMKPTYGVVSRYGLIAYASSLDQIGPIVKDVTDCALVMNVISGHDAKDSTSVASPEQDYTSHLKNDIQGLKVGIPKEYLAQVVDKRIKNLVYRNAEELTSLGAYVEETSLPHSEYALPAYYLIAMAEASSNLARYDGVRYGYRAKDVDDVIDMYSKTRSHGFDSEVKRRIMLGTYALSAGSFDAYYNKALKVRTLVRKDFNDAFERYDILIAPTGPGYAFKRGEKVDDPLQMYQVDICTLPINLAGIPAISIPAGQVDGLPVGLQFIGKSFAEGTILRAAYTFEQNTDYHKNKPSL